MCTFLRETTPCYNTGSTKLWSASDFPAELTEEERLRAPFTVLQFVSVRGAECYVVPPGSRVPVSATPRRTLDRVIAPTSDLSESVKMKKGQALPASISRA